jgi:hypothetical protein
MLSICFQKIDKNLTSSQINSKKEVRMDFRRGYEEESFLKQLEVAPKDVEFLAENCTKVGIRNLAYK